MKKNSKGTEIVYGKNKAVIVLDLMKFKDYYAIYADVKEVVDAKG